MTLQLHGLAPTWPALLLWAAAIAMLAAHVSLDLLRRVPLAAAQPAASQRWLVLAALGLGSGWWASAVLGFAACGWAAGAGFLPGAAALSWLLAVAVSGLGLSMISRLDGAVAVWRLTATGVLGLGFAAMHAVLGSAMGLPWRLDGLWPVALLGTLGALLGWMLHFSARHHADRRHRTRARWAAAVVWGGLMLAGQWASLQSTGWAGALRPLSDSGWPLTALTLLAAVGTPAVLLCLLVSAVIEAQLRVALGRARDELQQQIFVDPLTGLYSRQMFEAKLAEAARDADANKTSLALLFVDLDGFKQINESLGHRAGDRILHEMAERLRALAGEHDVVGRLGGDEFLLLLTGRPDEDSAARIAARVLQWLGQPWMLGVREASVTCSVGLAMYPELGTVGTLISHAEAAMRQSKSTGGASYSFFSASLIQDAREQAELLRDLRVAITNQQLELFYQPKLHAPSRQITGAEALMRWHHPKRGMVPPGLFIPLAERHGLINELGNWLIEEACRQIRAWRDKGLRMRVAINLSAQQLSQDDLVERIRETLTRYRIEPKRLTCEITESAAMGDSETTLKVIEGLSAAGVHLSIDDFGTGYSSLSYLRKLPAEELKIDRSFVLDLETSVDARAVVDAVVQLAKALSLKVVAEGVETEMQQEILSALGCDELQGYLFARPMSAQALQLWAMNDDGPRQLDFRSSLFGFTAMAELN